MDLGVRWRQRSSIGNGCRDPNLRRAAFLAEGDPILDRFATTMAGMFH
jgi:hypothetical protein